MLAVIGADVPSPVATNAVSFACAATPLNSSARPAYSRTSGHDIRRGCTPAMRFMRVVPRMRTSASSRAIPGAGSVASEFITVNSTTLVPIPSESTRTIVIVDSGVRRKRRNA